MVYYTCLDFPGLLVVLAIDEFRAFSQCGQTLKPARISSIATSSI
jgi:hypothetical protein